jgi:hypothetical protein
MKDIGLGRSNSKEIEKCWIGKMKHVKMIKIIKSPRKTNCLMFYYRLVGL